MMSIANRSRPASASAKSCQMIDVPPTPCRSTIGTPLPFHTPERAFAVIDYTLDRALRS